MTILYIDREYVGRDSVGESIKHGYLAIVAFY